MNLLDLADRITAAVLDLTAQPCVTVGHSKHGGVSVTVAYTDGNERVTSAADFADGTDEAAIVNNALLAVVMGSGEREPLHMTRKVKVDASTSIVSEAHPVAMTRHYSRRSDRNQSAIVKALRSIPGVSVADTSKVGNGFPDLAVGYCGRTYLLEVKDPTQRKADRKLKPSQVLFRSTWSGHYAVVETELDAIRAVLGEWSIESVSYHETSFARER